MNDKTAEPLPPISSKEQEAWFRIFDALQKEIRESSLPAPMQSPDIDKLAEALAKAQKAMEQPKKNKTAVIDSKRTGRSYSYEYADLPTVIDCLRDALADNGLSYIQRTQIEENRLVLETRLMHSSGQWVSSIWPLSIPDKEDPKQTAALLTYGRRYSLTSLCGISAEETDDDAERRATKKEPVTGKITKTALQKRMREFSGELHSCEDLGMLAGLLDLFEEDLAQCQRELPSWWDTKPGADTPGLGQQIEVKRMELERAEADEPVLMP